MVLLEVLANESLRSALAICHDADLNSADALQESSTLPAVHKFGVLCLLYIAQKLHMCCG